MKFADQIKFFLKFLGKWMLPQMGTFEWSRTVTIAGTLYTDVIFNNKYLWNLLEEVNKDFNEGKTVNT